MEKTFKTFDGVEVSCRELVWYCRKDGSSKIPHSHSHKYDFVPTENDIYHYFSTKEACQQYIDKMNQPVIFTTEDSIGVKLGDTFYCAVKNTVYGPYICDEHSSANEGGPYFLTKEKAQEYLDNLNKPVVFTTSDGVGIKVGDQYSLINPDGFLANGVCSFNDSKFYDDDDCIYFSTLEKAEEYINSLKSVEPTVVETSNMFLFEDALGQHVYENDTLYCCWKVPLINTVHDVIMVGVNRNTKLNPDFVYFKHKENCETYITNQKFESPELDGPIITEQPKSELEIAYDTLVALCAKYLNGVTDIVIHKNEQFPVTRTYYSIEVELDNVEFYEGPELDNLDDAIVLFHAFAIRVCNNIN
jgi:hypothetical protein